MFKRKIVYLQAALEGGRQVKMQEPQRYTRVRRRIVAVQPLDGGAGLINHLLCCTIEQVMIKMRTVPE